MRGRRARAAERLARLEQVSQHRRKRPLVFRGQVLTKEFLAAMSYAELDELCWQVLAEVELPEEVQAMTDDEIDEWCLIEIRKSQEGLD